MDALQRNCLSFQLGRLHLWPFGMALFMDEKKSGSCLYFCADFPHFNRHSFSANRHVPLHHDYRNNHFLFFFLARKSLESFAFFQTNQCDKSQTSSSVKIHLSYFCFVTSICTRTTLFTIQAPEVQRQFVLEWKGVSIQLEGYVDGKKRLYLLHS